MPRSKRFAASECSLCRRELRATDTESKCCLEQHVGRTFAHLGVRTAHDTGDADDARALSLGRVSDEQILGVELALFLIQGHKRLARAGTAHDDRGGQGAQVVGVHRLTEVKHDVVRDVDGQR